MTKEKVERARNEESRNISKKGNKLKIKEKRQRKV
jgi:hypothetical protein